MLDTRVGKCLSLYVYLRVRHFDPSMFNYWPVQYCTVLSKFSVILGVIYTLNSTFAPKGNYFKNNPQTDVRFWGNERVILYSKNLLSSSELRFARATLRSI